MGSDRGAILTNWRVVNECCGAWRRVWIAMLRVGALAVLRIIAETASNEFRRPCRHLCLARLGQVALAVWRIIAHRTSKEFSSALSSPLSSKS